MHSKKKIILAMPNHVGLYKVFKKNLEYLGFQVDEMLFVDKPFRYKNTWQRLHNLYRKLFLGDSTYKAKLVNDFFSPFYQNYLTDLPNDYCYALILRADLLHDSVLSAIKSNVKTMVSYHYDGLDRYPLIYEKIRFFDRFFVFDNKDKQHSDFFFSCTNFYFDYPEENSNTKEIYDFYFLGSYASSRIKIIEKLSIYLKELNHNVCFKLVRGKRKLHKNLQSSPMLMYQDYLKEVRQSKILVDFVIGDHSGLSFRIFEALKYSKKIITSNKEVAKYDFYHPNNIYIIENDAFVGLEEFLKLEYVPVDAMIYKKYSFENWMSYVLNLENHKPIHLP